MQHYCLPCSRLSTCEPIIYTTATVSDDYGETDIENLNIVIHNILN